MFCYESQPGYNLRVRSCTPPTTHLTTHPHHPSHARCSLFQGLRVMFTQAPIAIAKYEEIFKKSFFLDNLLRQPLVQHFKLKQQPNKKMILK